MDFEKAEFLQNPDTPGRAVTSVLLPVVVVFLRSDEGVTTVTFLTPNSSEVIFEHTVTDSWVDDDDDDFILETLLFGEDRAYATFSDALTGSRWWEK